MDARLKNATKAFFNGLLTENEKCITPVRSASEGKYSEPAHLNNQDFSTSTAMSEHESSDPQLHDELTAYLDGELDAESVRRVEERLARDTAYQAELQQLERAWDLLDRLPRSSVSETFTKTTIEMVAVAASNDAAMVQRAWPRRRLPQLLGALGAVAAGLAGFVVGHFLWPNPNEQLLQDLPVLEHFDLYYQVDNIDFLRMLDSEGLFAEAESDHAG